MDKSRIQVAWAGAGLALALTVGSPVLADDTELLISTPGSDAAKPNILFILDSSGSMRTIEETQEPYVPSVTYEGDCLPDTYYWAEGSSGMPSCDSENKQRFPKASFLCEQGIAQATASGSYKDTMSQYRGGNKKWRRLRWANSSPVECKADSGDHGDGSPSQVYARRGTNKPMFTSSPDDEVAWGNRPTDRIYTVYDSNYLNWFYNSPVVEMSRNEIVKRVTKNVMGSIGKVNVGFMQFNYSQGGPVTHALKDLDSNRSEAEAVVDALPASGWTPLSETMYEAALYWRGMNAKYGDIDDTDGDALVSSDPMKYERPAEYACAKNFNILLTDGEPTKDTDAYSLVPNLPEFKTELRRNNCTGGNNNGACLDDIAEYLSKVDINPDVDGDQTVATYTIGFTVDLDLLRDTAEKSGGEYYLAEDVRSLTVAITDIVERIIVSDISFTAPTVSVNAFNRTQHLNDLYISMFRASENFHWPGNLKKYSFSNQHIRDANGNYAVDTETGFFADNALSYWSTDGVADGPIVQRGGAAHQLPDPDARKLYTNKFGSSLTATSNHISVENIQSFQPHEFGMVGDVTEAQMADVIRWARGADVNDWDDNPGTEVRYQMGDTLHAQPAAVMYGESGGAGGGPDIVIYTATNDGYLHAIDAATGKELWSFVPHELLPNFFDLFNNESINYKNYGIDGDVIPVIGDRNKNGKIDGNDFVYLIFGMRRGGENYYALDVTNKDTPKIKWVKSLTNGGQSWSPPVIAKVAVSGAGQSSPDKAVVILGGGYDTVHDQSAHPNSPDTEGAGIIMLDLATGNELWRAGADASADLQIAKMTRSIPTRVKVLDLSGDGYADRMYASDMGGQVLRFDITSGSSPANLATGGVIAQLGAEGLGTPTAGDTRRMYNSPDLAIFHDEVHDRRYISISIGSGYRAGPLDQSATDRFYSIRDQHVFTALTQAQYNSYPVIKDSSLVDVQGKMDVELPPGSPGWKFTLPAGEKILAESTTFDDTVYFVSFEPQAQSSDPCQAGLSVNRLYRVSVVNGDPVVNKDALDPDEPEEIDEARVTSLEQGGIAPKPTFLFPSPDDPEDCEGTECTPPPVGCIGVECFDPNFTNLPVRTVWVQDGVL